MASIPSPAATAAGGSSVTVEDESPILKRCCGCSSDRPESDFSGAQLKKKGKRVCKGCVEQRELEEAGKADAAAAAKAAAHPSPSGTSSRPAAAAASPSTAAVCVVCGKGGAKLRACSRCRSLYCGAVCLKQHSSGDIDQCAAIRSLPPLSIADEERITAEEIEVHWPRIQRRIYQTYIAPRFWKSPPPHVCPDGMACCAITARDLSAVVDVYPPSAASPWWLPGDEGRITALRMQRFGRIFFEALKGVNDMFATVVNISTSEAITPAVKAQGYCIRCTVPHSPAVQDKSRLFHRLLRYWIYYMRHVDPSLVHSERPFVDVQSDEQGVIPVTVLKGDESDAGVAYCSDVDGSGRLTLLPAHFNSPPRTAAGSASPLLVAKVSLRDRDRRIMIRDGRIVDDAGLTCTVSDDRVDMRASTGRALWPSDSHCEAPLECTYRADSAIRTDVADRDDICDRYRSDMQSEVDARGRPDYFHLVPAMRAALAEAIFIATPRAAIETELAELLLLESLADEMVKDNSHSRLLVAHIEAECGATIGEVITAQRSRVEQMLADQRDQLRIHAEAVERHEQRGRMRLKAAGGDSSKSSSGSSGVASQSSSASSSAAPLGEPVGRLTLQSDFAAVSPSSHSAALSCSSAASSTGALSSGPATAAVVPVATTTATSPSAPCSWTAAHDSLESLRAPGRKKYGTILKAALRFLHSLRPVSVNRGGGSHIVFHFAAGSPVTLVQPHAGGRSKDGTAGAGYCTRLYQSLHSAALQQLQLGGVDAGSIGRSESAGSLPSAPPPPSVCAPRAALLPSPDSTAGASN